MEGYKILDWRKIRESVLKHSEGSYLFIPDADLVYSEREQEKRYIQEEKIK